MNDPQVTNATQSEGSPAPLLSAYIGRMIQKAVFEERESCARIAESFKEEAFNARTSVAEQIANEIRSGK